MKKYISQKSFCGLKPGDIIYARRYNNEEEKKNITEGHENCWYIIVDIKDNKLYCFEETSSSKVKKQSRKSYYTEFKGSFYNIKTIQELSVERVIAKYGKISEKKLEFLRNKYNVINNIDKELFKFQIGDIIYNKGLFLIIDIIENEDAFICLRVNGSVEKIIDEFSEKDALSIYYDKTRRRLNTANVRYINTVDKKILIEILKKYRNLLEKKEIIDIGAIILDNTNKYYVYGEIDNELICLPIWKKRKEGNIEIIANKKKYYTDLLEFERLSKENDYEIRGYSTDEEIRRNQLVYETNKNLNSHNEKIKKLKK